MSNVNILKANKNHKDFIIHANRVINNVNNTKKDTKQNNNTTSKSKPANTYNINPNAKNNKQNNKKK